MSPDSDDLTPEQRATLLLEKLGRPAAPSPPPPTPVEEQQRPQFDADLIPPAPTPYQRSAEDIRMDGVLASIDFATAYVKFIGKMTPVASERRREGIKISCPIPGHRDEHPSAWYNSETKLWFCGGCQRGGDIYDLGAIAFGYPLDTYKTNGTFPKLRRQIAEAFGYTVVSGITGQDYVVASEPAQVESPVEPSPQIANPFALVPAPLAPPLTPQTPSTPVTAATPEPTDNVELVSPIAPVVDIKSGQEIDLSDVSDIYIDWESLVTPDTFLWEWMKATTIDDLPHEFYFWQGLMALGFACGNTNYLADFRPVKPNFYVCLYGRTGLGKSRSVYPLLDLIEDVWPYRADPLSPPTGVMILPTPGSAEAIIDSFRYEIKDSSTFQVTGHGSVKGLLRHEELSGLISRAQRQGSSIKETLIEMFDVFEGDVTVRTRTSGLSKAHAPFCQMISTTQPNAVHVFLRAVDVESGFLNRWIFVAGLPRVEPISYGGERYDLTSPAALLRNVSVWAAMGHKMDLSGPALQVWDSFFKRELSHFKSGVVNMDSIHSRTDLVLKKVIVTLTANEMLDQPTPEVVEKAIALMPYLRATYSMFSGDLSFSDVTDCQARLIEIAQQAEAAKKPYPSRRELQRGIGKRFDNEVLLRSLKNLVDLGLFEEIAPQPGDRGRPTTRYRYVE